MSLDSSWLWDFGHQLSAFSASLSGGSSPAKSFPINTYILEKQLIHGHPQFINNTYIQSTVLHIHLLDELIYFLNIPSLFYQILLITNYKSNKTRRHWNNNRTINLSIRKLD